MASTSPKKLIYTLKSGKTIVSTYHCTDTELLEIIDNFKNTKDDFVIITKYEKNNINPKEIIIMRRDEIASFQIESISS